MWTLSLIPFLAFFIGGVVGMIRSPSAVVTSGVQHFAAGLVFAAAATEILPDLKHEGAALPVAVGGILGVLVMLGVKQMGERSVGALGTFAVFSVDLLVDGLVLGIAFAAGTRQGLVLTFALTVEVLFLGLTMALALSSQMPSRMRLLAAIAGAGLLLPIGIMLGVPAGALPPAYLTALFAFSLIALLYLVVEELLVEAHFGPESPFIASLFFVGFLMVLILEEFA